MYTYAMETSAPENDEPRSEPQYQQHTVAFVVILVTGILLLLYTLFIMLFQNDVRTTAVFETDQAVPAELPPVSAPKADRLPVSDGDTQAKQLREPAETVPVYLPVVTYKREGLLSDDERAALTERFIEPYVDYHAMEQEDRILVAVTISVPAESNGHYTIESVWADGTNGGFRFGNRSAEYEYWIPSCYGGCIFGDEFKKAHPEVVERHDRLP